VEHTVWFLLAAFHGNEVHGGTSPSLKPKGAAELFKFMEEIWEGTPPPNRCGWVVYHPWAATTRAASVAVSPALTFMNQGAPAPHKETYLNFSEHAAESKLLGDLCSFHNRLNREYIYHGWNLHQYTRANVGGRGFDITETLPLMTYSDESGMMRHCEPVPFHPIEHALYVAEMRGRFQWLWDVVYIHCLGVTKTAMKDARERREAGTIEASNSGPTISMMPAQRPTFYSTAGPPHGEELVEDSYAASASDNPDRESHIPHVPNDVDMDTNSLTLPGSMPLTSSEGDQVDTSSEIAGGGSNQQKDVESSLKKRKRKQASEDDEEDEDEDEDEGALDEHEVEEDGSDESGEECEIEMILDSRFRGVRCWFVFNVLSWLILASRVLRNFLCDGKHMMNHMMNG
jgi:hypothetical protein